MRLHKHGEAAAQGHCPPSPHAAAPCGVGVLEGPGAYAEYQCRQWDQENNMSSAARCDCGKHTFCLLGPQEDESMDTAPNTPDLSSGGSVTSDSQNIREKRGWVVSGETTTNSSRRHLVLLSEAGLSSSCLASAAAEGGDPADIENLSASMVQAMTRKGGSTGGAVSGSNSGSNSNQKDSNNTAPSGVPPTPAAFGLSPPQEQPQDHHLPVPHHHHPHPPQQPYQPQQQRRRGSVSGADGSSRRIDGSSSLVGGGSEEPGALSLNRILVERNGDMVVVESSVVCDACPSCDDVCTLPDCRGCQEKRERLLAKGLMVVVEGWGRTTRKKSVQKQQESSSEGGVCMPIIAKPRTTNNDNSSHNDTYPSSSHHVSYSLCEIRRHRTLASCWLVAKGQVYDVTPYLSSHPAGAIAIARKAGGQDCSEDFEFHSGKAQKIWKKLRIGSVKACPAEARCGGRGRGGGREDGSLVGSSCSIM